MYIHEAHDNAEMSGLCNKYFLKTTKDQKPCFICGKFGSSVLDAPDDFFFACLNHLKDSGFCTPIYVDVPATVEPPVKIATDEKEKELEKLKKEIEELKSQIGKSPNGKDKIGDTKADSKPSTTDDVKDKDKPKEPIKASTPTPPVRKIDHYQLHRSILYLREQQKLQQTRARAKLDLLKSLK